ncbi:MAG: serine hydrolase [Cyanobacteria bacterium P01_G01_bin.19]
MNRKGKKSPTTAKKTKASRKTIAARKNSNISQSKKQAVFAKNRGSKSNQRKSLVKTIARNNSKPSQNLAAKKNIEAKSETATTVKPKFSLWMAIQAIAIIVGLSTILGTTVSIANSFDTPNSGQKTVAKSPKNNSSFNQSKLRQLLTLSSLKTEINPLKTNLEELAEKYPELEPELFLVDLDTKGFVSIRGKNRIASASTIKLPILVAFFQDLDRGKIQLDEQLTMTEDAIAGGSGDMQHQQPGTKFSALETAEKMIVISDNTATNMLIERLGGIDELNQRFLSMGLTNTQLSNPLPDLTGTNTTSSEDLGNLLLKIDNGDLISLRSRDRLLHIMSNVEKDTLLPQGLEPGALIAHKTGDIKSVLADVGMVDMPNGKRYIASMLVGRPDNSAQAQEFIQQASGIAYQYFKQPANRAFTLEEQE